MAKHHKRHNENRIAPDPAGSGTVVDELLPEFEEVQKLAYQLHEQNGGTDLDNWLEAERILKEEHQKTGGQYGKQE